MEYITDAHALLWHLFRTDVGEKRFVGITERIRPKE